MDACGNKPRTKLDNLAARRFRNLTARYYQIDDVLILFERFSWNQAHLIRSCFRACLPVFVRLSVVWVRLPRGWASVLGVKPHKEWGGAVSVHAIYFCMPMGTSRL